jgi:hypothetical protein
MESKKKRRNTQTTDATEFAAMSDALSPTGMPDPSAPAVSNLEQGGPSSGTAAPDLQGQQPEENLIPGGEEEERDAEIEDELANELRGDPLADYDIDITKEADALCEYASLLSSVLSKPL